MHFHFRVILLCVQFQVLNLYFILTNLLIISLLYFKFHYSNMNQNFVPITLFLNRIIIMNFEIKFTFIFTLQIIIKITLIFISFNLFILLNLNFFQLIL